jgi:exopolyphosphatase / guanosine-5'-triphosphate,3'-diphosphate pyrophosphatase
MVKCDAQLLARMSTLLRLAEDLERPRDQLVRAAHAHVSDGRVELRLVTEGDASVSRWAAARETDLFASAFGHELVVE